MDFSDLPRRQRPTRYPAPAQYEDGYAPYGDIGTTFGNGDRYRGLADMDSAPAQRAWWEPAQSSAGTGATSTFSPFDDNPAFSGEDIFGDQAAMTERTAPAVRTAPAERTAPDGRAGSRSAGRHSRRQRDRGLLAGAVAGFLAAAVALGVANLAAAFVRPQASPIIAVGGAFIDRTPPALKNFAVQEFGENDKNVLLLSMYVTIALIALAVGMLAWRRIAIGVAGIGLFGLFGAFVAITRPDSQISDVIPAIVGGIAGIAAIIVLIRAGTRRTGNAAPAHDTGWMA